MTLLTIAPTTMTLLPEHATGTLPLPSHTHYHAPQRRPRCYYPPLLPQTKCTRPRTHARTHDDGGCFTDPLHRLAHNAHYHYHHTTTAITCTPPPTTHHAPQLSTTTHNYPRRRYFTDPLHRLAHNAHYHYHHTTTAITCTPPPTTHHAPQLSTTTHNYPRRRYFTDPLHRLSHMCRAACLRSSASLNP